MCADDEDIARADLAMRQTPIGRAIHDYLIGEMRRAWLPGYSPVAPSGLLHLVLPAFSASVLAVAIIARLTRSSVIDAMNSDYAKMFAAAGMSRMRLLRTQIIRNVLPPIVSIGGLQFGTLFGGVIFVETVFAWPGLSAQLYNAITAHDIPVIQTGVLMIAATFVLINLVVDLLLIWLNPRMRG